MEAKGFFGLFNFIFYFIFFNGEGEATAEETYLPRALALALNAGTPGGPEYVQRESVSASSVVKFTF